MHQSALALYVQYFGKPRFLGKRQAQFARATQARYLLPA
jgi:hypothetical protein